MVQTSRFVEMCKNSDKSGSQNHREVGLHTLTFVWFSYLKGTPPALREISRFVHSHISQLKVKLQPQGCHCRKQHSTAPLQTTA